MEKLLPTLGERIANIRKTNGLSRADLGDLLGVKEGAVGKYERGESDPGAEAILKVAKLGRCTTDWLISGQEKSEPSDQPQYTTERGIEATVNEATRHYNGGPLKITRQEEELIYLLREIPADMQPIALEGVRNVWVMARRKRETQQSSE